MILEGKNLKFSYDNKNHVINNLNITIGGGERIGLTAPSGRGKTTLCKILAGYERPQEGQVLLDGIPLSKYRGFSPVQMLWQHPELAVNPLLVLEKTLHEAGRVEERILDNLHIQPGWLKRFPKELSGGELQRFCIARALHPEVGFLLCDEISAMLDLLTQAQLWEFLIKEAGKRNLGLLIISHNSKLLERVCTRVAAWDELAGEGVLGS